MVDRLRIDGICPSIGTGDMWLIGVGIGGRCCDRFKMLAAAISTADEWLPIGSWDIGPSEFAPEETGAPEFGIICMGAEVGWTRDKGCGRAILWPIMDGSGGICDWVSGIGVRLDGLLLYMLLELSDCGGGWGLLDSFFGSWETIFTFLAFTSQSSGQNSLGRLRSEITSPCQLCGSFLCTRIMCLRTVALSVKGRSHNLHL